MNKIFNGDFNAAVNAGPVPLTNSPAYATVDRWAVFQNTTAAGISAQVASGLTGFKNCLKIGRNQANFGTHSIVTQSTLKSIDSIPLAGKTFTLSFYAKAGAHFSGANVNVAVFSGTGTDQPVGSMSGWTGAATPIATTQAITPTWVRYQLTGTMAASATQVGVRFYYDPTGTAGADDNLYLTGVQLEEGAVATPFAYRPYSFELTLSRPQAFTCGRLSNLGPSDPFGQCHFIPHNGNLILINDVPEVIPDGVIAVSGGVIASYTNCSIDKVVGQSLAANTFYFVYVYMLNGVMTLDFSTTAYIPDTRNQVKATDPTCTLVGILQTNSAIKTYGGARGQTISSYFNQFRTSLATAVAGSTGNNAATALPDGGILDNGEPQNNFLEWVQWGDQTPKVRAFANLGNSVAGNRVTLGIGISTKTAISGVGATAQVPSNLFPSLSLYVQAPPSDQTGYVYAQAMAYETEDAGPGLLTASGFLFADNIMV